MDGATGPSATQDGGGEGLTREALLSRYLEGGFAEVHGWGMNKDLARIFGLINHFQQNRGIRGPLAEIGVQDGRVLIVLALFTAEGETAVGIDIFENQSENLDRSGANTTYNTVVENCAVHAPGARVKLIKANSFRLAPEDLERLRGFRFMHVDGGHYFEVVMNDLEIAQRMIGGGGVIVMDDYWHSGFPEVQEAVHRYFWTSPVIKAAPFMVGQNKLFLASHEIRTDLLAFMRKSLPENRRRPVRVLSYEAICCDPEW